MPLWGSDGIELEKEKLKNNLKMVRSKKRVFDQMWDAYSEAFKTHYESLRRYDRAQLVNSGIIMEHGRYANKIMDQYSMEENIRKEKERENSIRTGGVIQEVAEVSKGNVLEKRVAYT